MPHSPRRYKYGATPYDILYADLCDAIYRADKQIPDNDPLTVAGIRHTSDVARRIARQVSEVLEDHNLIELI